MWKVDTGGGNTFSDATNPNQIVLFGNEPDLNHLKHICNTPFLSSHIRRILIPMEMDIEITVLTERKKVKS